MAYEKRLCILKQIKKGFSADGSALSGAVYCERLGGELIVTPRIAGIAPVGAGRYALVVSVGGQNFCLELRGNDAVRIPDAPSLRDGFSVLLCFVKAEAEPVAFGHCGLAPADYRALLGVFRTGKTEKRPPVPLSPFEQPVHTNPQAPKAPTVPTAPPEEEESAPFQDGLAARYDDEAITDADYFRGEIPTESEDEGAAVCGAEQAPPQEGGVPAGGNDEDGALYAPRLNRGGLTYYNEVRERVEKALKEYPADGTLLSVFPRSEWVRAGGGLLGVIYREGLPRYLCVAADATAAYPEEMKTNGIFVPVGDGGYMVVFQDAETGEYVRVYDA